LPIARSIYTKPVSRSQLGFPVTGNETSRIGSVQDWYHERKLPVIHRYDQTYIYMHIKVHGTGITDVVAVATATAVTADILLDIYKSTLTFTH